MKPVRKGKSILKKWEKKKYNMPLEIRPESCLLCCSFSKYPPILLKNYRVCYNYKLFQYLLWYRPHILILHLQTFPVTILMLVTSHVPILQQQIFPLSILMSLKCPPHYNYKFFHYLLWRRSNAHILPLQIFPVSTLTLFKCSHITTTNFSSIYSDAVQMPP